MCKSVVYYIMPTPSCFVPSEYNSLNTHAHPIIATYLIHTQQKQIRHSRYPIYLLPHTHKDIMWNSGDNVSSFLSSKKLLSSNKKSNNKSSTNRDGSDISQDGDSSTRNPLNEEKRSVLSIPPKTAKDSLYDNTFKSKNYENKSMSPKTLDQQDSIQYREPGSAYNSRPRDADAGKNYPRDQQRQQNRFQYDSGAGQEQPYKKQERAREKQTFESSFKPVPASPTGLSKSESRARLRKTLLTMSKQLTHQTEEVSSLIDDFDRRINQFIEEEYNRFREAILDTVDAIFMSAKQEFRRAFRPEEKRFKIDVLKLRTELEKMHDKLSIVSEDIIRVSASQWKKFKRDIEEENITENAQSLIMKAQQVCQLQGLSITLGKNKMIAYEEALQNLVSFKSGGDVNKVDSPQPRRYNN